MTDHNDVTATFNRVSTLEVPRELDVSAIQAGGHRRLVRRRIVTAAGSIGTASAAVAAIAIALPGPQTGQGLAGGPTPTARPTSGPTATAAPRLAPRPTTSPTAAPGLPERDWMLEVDAKLRSMGFQIPAHGGGADSDSAMTQLPIVRGGSAGYFAAMATEDPQAVAAARRNPCAIPYQPKDGTGRSCRAHDNAWTVTYQDSNQGRTEITRVVTKWVDLVVAQSVGFPSYRQSTSDNPQLLPWDGRDPLAPEAGKPLNRKVPALDRMPLTQRQVMDLANAQLSIKPGLS